MNDLTPVLALDLYLIRHAQSFGNVPRDDISIHTLEEQEDPLLTDIGLQQASALGKYYKNVSFDAVLSSGMLRTLQTAEAFMRYQNTKKPITVNPIFTEFNISPDYHGVTWGRVLTLCPGAVRDDEADFSNGLITGSSSDDEKTVLHRANDALQLLKNRYRNGEKVAVFSHAGFITNMLFSLFGFSECCPTFDISFHNTGVTEIKFYQPGTNPYGDAVIEYINKTNHLERGASD